MAERGVTLKKAGQILGGDRPLSTRTVSAMVTRGDLEAYGKRKTRRVTERSIELYQRGIPWRDARNQSSASDANAEPDTPARRRTGHGQHFTRDIQRGGTHDVVLIGERTPKRGATRSQRGSRRERILQAGSSKSSHT